jgi:hypothetical protein
MKRPQEMRLVNPARLNVDAQQWLFEVLEFQYIHRWDFYLRNFKFPVSASVHSGPWWHRFRTFLKNRFSQVRAAAVRLQQRAQGLIDSGHLPLLIWYDPALFYFHEDVLQVLPKEFHYTSFAEAMSLAQAQEPARTYWVDCPQEHPFYVLGLQRLYKNRYPIPLHPVFDPREGPMGPDYAFLANLPDPSVSSTSVFYSITRPQTRLCLGLDPLHCVAGCFF